MTHPAAEVQTVVAPGEHRFRVVLFLVLALYAFGRCLSFALPALMPGRAAAVPAVVETAFSQQAWAFLWFAGGVLHLLAIRWDWAADATRWTFAIKGLSVAAAFVVSAVAVGTSLPASIGGAMSYAAPVVFLWLIQWSMEIRPTKVIRQVPLIEAAVVADEARARLTESGEIPEVHP